MTMPETTPEMLAMADNIVVDLSDCETSPEIAFAMRNAALAAIKETTERAAVKVDTFREAHEAKRKTTKRHQREFAAHIDACNHISFALRNGEHYHD